MSTYSTGGLAAEHEAVLRGFGLGPSELADPGEAGGPMERLRRGLARSSRGVEAPRRYWATAPAFQLGSALERFGYDLRLEAPDGGEIDPSGGFEVVLEGEATTRRASFRYPEDGHGRDDYPALVGAVESRLLPDGLRFVRLADDGDHWRFFLARNRGLEGLRDRFGERIELDDGPLLADRQPSDAFSPSLVDEGGADPDHSAGEIPADGIESAFESVERAAATGPVDPADRGEELDLAEVAPELDDPAVVRDVHGDRLEDAVDGLASAGGAIGRSGDPGGAPDPNRDRDGDASPGDAGSRSTSGRRRSSGRSSRSTPGDPDDRRGSRVRGRTDGGSPSLASRIERLEDRASDVSRGSGGEGRADRTRGEARANRTRGRDRGDAGHGGNPSARDVGADRPDAGPDGDTGGGLSSKVAAALETDAGAAEAESGRPRDDTPDTDGLVGLGRTDPEDANGGDREDTTGADLKDVDGADPEDARRSGTRGSSGSGEGPESDSGRYPDWRLDLEEWADDTSEDATPSGASGPPNEEDSSGETTPDDRAESATDREDADSEQSAVERLSETVDRLL